MTTATPTRVEGTYTSDGVHSKFSAKARHMGIDTFRTSFEEVEAELRTGDEGLELTGRARVDSIVVRNEDLRTHLLKGDDFFDAANHPVIAFRSHDLQLADNGSVRLDGELTIKGNSRTIEATGTWSGPIEDAFGSERISIDLVSEIDRRDYGMTWQMPLPKGGDALGWKVTIEVNLALVRS